MFLFRKALFIPKLVINNRFPIIFKQLSLNQQINKLFYNQFYFSNQYNIGHNYTNLNSHNTNSYI